MTRIIAGAARGRLVNVPRTEVRPTSSLVREAIFNSVTGLIEDWGQERVLDVFAGSGALGFEAVSRGAQELILIENNRAAVATLRENAASIGLGGEILVADAMHLPPNWRGSTATLVLADPPYNIDPDQLRDALGNWLSGGWIAPDAILVLEGPTRWSNWQWPTGIDGIRSRRYGETTVWYGSAESVDYSKSTTDKRRPHGNGDLPGVF